MADDRYLTLLHMSVFQLVMTVKMKIRITKKKSLRPVYFDAKKM
jgi:hypothetical protein